MTNSILVDQLRSRGLFVNEKLFELCAVEDLTDEVLWKQGLNSDLRVVGVEALPKDLHSVDRLAEQRICLQILSVSNIAQPSAKQTVPGLYPRLLQLRLTDGIQKIVALEASTIPRLSATTPPGTKILIKSPQVRNGKLLLTEENTEVLGGQVYELYRSWKANKDLKEKKRVCGADKADPPPLFTEFTASNKIAPPKTKQGLEGSKPISSKLKKKEKKKKDYTPMQQEVVSRKSDTPRSNNNNQGKTKDKEVETNDKVGASKSLKEKSTLRVTKEFVPKFSPPPSTENLTSSTTTMQQSEVKSRKGNVGSKKSKSQGNPKDPTSAESPKILSKKPSSANTEGKSISHEQKPGNDRTKAKDGNGDVRDISGGRGKGRGRGGGRGRGPGGKNGSGRHVGGRGRGE